jgi:hypothetical protein
MAIIAATPVSMIPGIIAGAVIDADVTWVIAIIGWIRSRISIVGIGGWAVIAAADSYSDAHMHPGIGLAGKAQHSQ